jgi:hypothetical protein
MFESGTRTIYMPREKKMLTSENKNGAENAGLQGSTVMFAILAVHLYKGIGMCK